MKRTAICVFAAVFICVAAAFAQSGAEVEEIIRERPSVMVLAEAEADRPALPDEYSVDHPTEGDTTEAVPAKVVEDVKKKVTTASTKEESAHENLFALGGRLNVLGTFGLDGYAKIPMGEITRLDVGMSFGLWPGKKGYNWMYHVEALGSYEWRFDIDDGVLGWYAGPAAALGLYWTSKDIPAQDVLKADSSIVTIRKHTESDNPHFGVGIGGVVGLEVDLSFIDADHALYSLKDISVGANLRPMLYIRGKHFRWWGIAFGLSGRWAL